MCENDKLIFARFSFKARKKAWRRSWPATYQMRIKKIPVRRLLYCLTLVSAFCGRTGMCSEGVEAHIHDAPELASLAISAIKGGDLISGARYLNLAIDANPNDAGKACEPRDDILEGDRWWGELQLTLMLKDRPTMSEHIVKGDALWEWVCYQFSGDDSHGPVQWDPVRPWVADAINVPGDSTSKASIAISDVYTRGLYKGAKQPFERLWVCAVFELYSVRRERSFARLHDLAEQKRISKRDYLESFYRLELQAVQETRAFYAKLYLPWALGNDVPTDPQRWYVGGYWGTFQEMFDRFEAHKENPWNVYGALYDVLTESNLEDALRVLRYPETEEEILRAMGYP